MVDIENKIMKITTSAFHYRIVELLLLFVMFIFGGYALYQNITFLFFITIGVIGYISFIVEHKQKIIINRIDNKFLIMEKALFRNCYKVLKNINLDMIEYAYVYEFSKIHYNTNSKNNNPEGTTMYKLNLKCKNEEFFDLTNWASSEKKHIETKVNQVNTALQSEESYIELEEKPCIIRCLFGLPFLILYFLFSILCIKSYHAF